MGKSITKNKVENRNGWGSLGWMYTTREEEKKLHELNYIKMIKPNVPSQTDEGRWGFNRA